MEPLRKIEMVKACLGSFIELNTADVIILIPAKKETSEIDNQSIRCSF